MSSEEKSLHDHLQTLYSISSTKKALLHSYLRKLRSPQFETTYPFYITTQIEKRLYKKRNEERQKDNMRSLYDQVLKEVDSIEEAIHMVSQRLHEVQRHNFYSSSRKRKLGQIYHGQSLTQALNERHNL